jgi:hypothetical protein
MHAPIDLRSDTVTKPRPQTSTRRSRPAGARLRSRSGQRRQSRRARSPRSRRLCAVSAIVLSAGRGAEAVTQYLGDLQVGEQLARHRGHRPVQHQLDDVRRPRQRAPRTRAPRPASRRPTTGPRRQPAGRRRRGRARPAAPPSRAGSPGACAACRSRLRPGRRADQPDLLAPRGRPGQPHCRGYADQPSLVDL